MLAKGAWRLARAAGGGGTRGKERCVHGLTERGGGRQVRRRSWQLRGRGVRRGPWPRWPRPGLRI
eukprot:9439342-Pyramimonas_sp.AAC.1